MQAFVGDKMSRMSREQLGGDEFWAGLEVTEYCILDTLLGDEAVRKREDGPPGEDGKSC